MRGGCFAARTKYVRDAFAWELAGVVLYWDQCTSSAVHPAWSRNLLAGCAEADDDVVGASASDGFNDLVVSTCLASRRSSIPPTRT